MLTSISYSGMSSRLTHMASESSSFCMWIVSSPSSSAVKPAISESLKGHGNPAFRTNYRTFFRDA